MISEGASITVIKRVFERDTTKEELRAGVQLQTGWPVILFLGGVGHGTGDGGPTSEGAGSSPGNATGGSGPGPLGSTPAPGKTGPDQAGEAAEPTPHDALDVQLVSATGAPRRALEWEVTLADGTKRAGHTDDQGRLRLAGLAAKSNCTLDLPDLDPSPGPDAAPATAAGRVRYAKDLPLQAGTSTVVELPSRVHRGQLKGLHFETAKSFLLPSAIPGIRQLRALYESFGAELAALVSGHTATVGTASYNRGLSQQRAASIASFLVDDAEGWMRFYSPQPNCDRWGVREDQFMLVQVGGAALAVDGKAGAGTQAAYKKFQTAQGLPESGRGDDATRRALLKAYQAQQAPRCRRERSCRATAAASRTCTSRPDRTSPRRRTAASRSSSSRARSRRCRSTPAPAAAAPSIRSGPPACSRSSISMPRGSLSQVHPDPNTGGPNMANRISFIELPTASTAPAKAFYAAAFGLTMTDFGPTYACTMSGDVDLGLQADAREATSAPLPVIQVESLEATLALVLGAGGAVTKPAFAFPGGRRFHFRDPSGNELAAMQQD